MIDRDKREAIFETVAVIGPGLIGGSFGLAARQRGLVRRVIGIGRRRASLEVALSVGAADEVSTDVSAAREADLVVIATPIGTIEALMPAIAAALRPGAVLTEVSSVKASVIRIVTKHLPPGASLVPTHPMAGSDRRGAQAADGDLYVNSICIFTPVAASAPEDVVRLETLWRGLGARIMTMTPEEHDRAVAAVSHVPHLIASAVVEGIDDVTLRCAGTGLIDLTRIASGDPDMWTDICAHNRDAVVPALDAFAAVLARLKACISAGDLEGLHAVLARSKERRDRLVAARGPRKGSGGD